MTVATLILTYDAPASLVECVRLTLAQTRPPDEILVVDNAGAAIASDVLAEANLLGTGITVLRTPANRGPAGGYETALRWFLDSDHDAAWAMDDDCRPDPGALLALERRADRESEPSVVFPLEVDGADGTRLNNPSWCGVWLPRAVVATVGLPRGEFIWWMEDTEYLHLRMSGAAIPVVREETAVVTQSRARRTGDPPVWKVYYETRNSAFVRFHIRGRVGLHRWLLRMIRRLGRIVVREEMRTAKIGAFVQGIVDGVRGRLDKRFPLG